MPNKTYPVTRTITLVIAIILTLFVTACANSPSQPATPEKLADSPEIADIQTRANPEEQPVTVRSAESLELKPSAPDRYVVQKGDTLWALAQKYLHDPWYWPEIWDANPQVQNPHLIYPGDILSLYYIDGRPYLRYDNGTLAGALTERRLSPNVRREPLAQEDLSLPVSALQQFIVRPRVVSEEMLAAAPYILGTSSKRLVYASGDNIYARGISADSQQTRYTVFRPGKQLVDPETNELLGYEAVHVGDAEVVKIGDPTAITLLNTEREALQGDRLFPVDDNDKDQAFFPHAPNEDFNGRIISLFDAISQVGQYQVVVLNRGNRDGIEKGHVVGVTQAGVTVQDPNASGELSKTVTIPGERTGIAMVFRIFDKVSYALVMEATSPIHVGDTVVRP